MGASSASDIAAVVAPLVMWIARGFAAVVLVSLWLNRGCDSLVKIWPHAGKAALPSGWVNLLVRDDMSENQTKVPHMDASGSDAFRCDFPLEGCHRLCGWIPGENLDRRCGINGGVMSRRDLA
jgi:hypothetical protein